MASFCPSALKTKKALRTLFDEHRIIWDILRCHRYFVAKNNVKQFMPPESFVSRNYVSNNDVCKINLVQLQVFPWISLFISPDNAILYTERDAIVPIDNATWQFIDYDQSKFSTADPNDMARQGFTLPDSHLNPSLNRAVDFIPSRHIAISDNNRALNFNPQASNDINITSALSGTTDAICNPKLELQIGLSSQEDFLQGNIDNDINRFERLDYNPLSWDDRQRRKLLRTTLLGTGIQHNPSYSKVDNNWSKYLTAITNGDDEAHDDQQDSDWPPAKRARDNLFGSEETAPLASTLFTAEPTEPSTSTQNDFFN